MNSDSTRKQFEQAFEQYSDDIFRYSYFRLNDRERAMEITQESFMKAWKAAVEGEEILNIKAFLYRIVHNLVANEYRDRKPNSSLDELSETVGYDPAADTKSPEEESEIKMAVALLEKLDARDKEIMILRYVNDLPVKEIAKIIGETDTAVSVKIHRTIKKLQKLIQ